MPRAVRIRRTIVVRVAIVVDVTHVRRTDDNSLL